MDVARAADRVGIDRVLVSDHVVFGADLSDYGRPEVGGTRGGRQPTGPDGQWLDPLVVLSWVASHTNRVRLGTSILLAAIRRPVSLAKTLATLDVLSGGRLDVGVGVGWQRAEYEAAGLDFDTRGSLLDHSLAVMRALWGPDPVDFADERLALSSVYADPKPIQPGGVPIWISGTVNPAVARRIARFGTGWITWGEAARDPGAAIARMRDLVAQAGGDASSLRVSAPLSGVTSDAGVFDVAATFERVPRLVAAGVTDLQLAVGLSGSQDRIEATLRLAVEALAAVT